MGATLGHLVVIDFNITKMQCALLTGPIDYAASDPKEKANKIISLEKLLSLTKWESNDRIIRIITIPQVMPSIATVHGISTQEDEVDIITKSDGHFKGFIYNDKIFKPADFKDLTDDLEEVIEAEAQLKEETESQAKAEKEVEAELEPKPKRLSFNDFADHF